MRVGCVGLTHIDPLLRDGLGVLTHQLASIRLILAHQKMNLVESRMGEPINSLFLLK